MNNNYRRKNYGRKRSFNRRRQQEPFHQPLPPNLERIPHSRHTLTKPDVEAVVDALLSGTLMGGNELDRFESLFAKLTHSRHALALNSATAALHAALKCLQLSAGDEIIASTLNCTSIANAVETVGASLVLVDCDPDTLTISVESARSALTPKTKVIISNNFAGHPADLSPLRELCDEYELILIDDARHGLGGKYRGHYIGNQADITCFSFAPDMAITCGDGGAITTDHSAYANWIRLFRDNGIERDPAKLDVDHQTSYWCEVQFPGLSYQMSELNAALGRSQLTRLDRHIERRRTIAEFYFQKLEAVADLILPHRADWAEHAFHTFPIQLTGQLYGKRDNIYQALIDRGVQTQVHYIPIHRMPFYSSKADQPSRFPNSESYFHNCLSLPLFPDLSIKAMERICETIVDVLSQFRATDSSSSKSESTGTGDAKTKKKTKSETPSGEPLSTEPTEETAAEPAAKSRAKRPSRTRSRTTRPKKAAEPKGDSKAAAEVEQEVDEKPKKKAAPRKRAPSKKAASKENTGEAQKPTRRRAPRKKKADEEKPAAEPKES